MLKTNNLIVLRRIYIDALPIFLSSQESLFQKSIKCNGIILFMLYVKKIGLIDFMVKFLSCYAKKFKNERMILICLKIFLTRLLFQLKSLMLCILSVFAIYICS